MAVDGDGFIASNLVRFEPGLPGSGHWRTAGSGGQRVSTSFTLVPIELHDAAATQKPTSGNESNLPTVGQGSLASEATANASVRYWAPSYTKDDMPAAPAASHSAVRSLAVLALAVSAGLIGCTSAPTAPLPTVASVELPRYMGSWYEIAMLPNRFQASCASDTVATYRMKDDGVEVINRCRHADGSVDSIQGRAKVVPGSAGSRLRVSFFWPIYGDY